MNIASQVADVRARGFAQEQGEVIVLMKIATGILFKDFPDAFVLFGGGNLVLFQGSARHSGDLDFQLQNQTPPFLDEIRASLKDGLQAAAEALSLAPLLYEPATLNHAVNDGWDFFNRLYVKGSGRLLFTVDLCRHGNVIASEITEYPVAIDDETIATVKAVSIHYTLLQKAECFLFRPKIKTRDAYDIYSLLKRGATLGGNLKFHLEDSLTAHEVEAEQIETRIAFVDTAHCTHELKTLLSSKEFDAISENGFAVLRDALRKIYGQWLD